MPDFGNRAKQGESLLGGRSEDEYVMALDCGHRTYTSNLASAGIEWCSVCDGYVGVIVTHIACSRCGRISCGCTQGPTSWIG